MLCRGGAWLKATLMIQKVDSEDIQWNIELEKRVTSRSKLQYMMSTSYLWDWKGAFEECCQDSYVHLEKQLCCLLIQWVQGDKWCDDWLLLLLMVVVVVVVAVGFLLCKIGYGAS